MMMMKNNVLDRQNALLIMTGRYGGNNKGIKIMKTKITIISLFFTINSYCQTPSWEWAKSGGGINNDDGTSVVTDASGNVYVTGWFSSPSFLLSTTTLTNDSAGSGDIFVVKYDGLGNVLWAKSFGGISDDYGNGVAIDGNGNVFITGYFHSTTITFGTTTLTRVGGNDVFIVKCDSFGNVIWAKSAGGSANDESNSIALDSSGNVLIIGSFNSPSITFGTTTLASAGGNDIFIVKYDTGGNVIWAKGEGGTAYDWGSSVATDVSGNILITGYFKSTTIVFGTTTLNNAGIQNTFVAKYNVSGNALWAKSMEGTTNNGNDISTDNTGNVFVTGSFSAPGIIGTDTLTGNGTVDIFIVKFNALGSVLWFNGAGSGSLDSGNSIATDANGNIYETGFYSGYINFGATTFTNGGYAEIFVVKYDTFGNVLWAQNVGSANGNSNIGNGITTDGYGNVFTTGYFLNPTLTFGTINVTNAGNYDMFIAKLNSATGIEENIQNNEINIYPNPATNMLQIASSKFQVEGIKIYNVMGEKVISHWSLVNSNSVTVDVSGLENGMYFVEVYFDKLSNGGAVRKKFVKE